MLWPVTKRTWMKAVGVKTTVMATILRTPQSGCGQPTCEVAIYQITLNRGRDSLEALLGNKFTGIVTSDRYSVYKGVRVERRQVCWAHLIRDFQRIVERSGVFKGIGTTSPQRVTRRS